MKHIISWFLLFILLCSLFGCAVPGGSNAERIYEDALGRQIPLPDEIHKVAPAGLTAQLYLLALCPEKLAGIVAPWEEKELAYLSPAYADLPVLGQLYGGKGDWNPESLLSAGVELVIDIGEAREGLAADLDTLQAQTGIPFVHIQGSLTSMEEAFSELGKLLSCADTSKVLADYCTETVARGKTLSDSVQKKKVLWLTGGKGLRVIARGSFQGQVLDLLADNPAVVELPSSRSNGNEVDREQLLLWEPELILCTEEAYAAAPWELFGKELPVYRIPSVPVPWLGSPPSVQQQLGLLWLGAILYPEAIDYDLQDEVKTYFRLFYHTELTDAEYDTLMQDSLPCEP